MRKLSLLLVFMVLLVYVLSACSSSSNTSNQGQIESGNKQGDSGKIGGNEVITLKYWGLFSGGDAEFMNAMVDKFNETHSDVQVEMLNLKWEEYYTKLRTAIVAKQGPDVAVAHTSKLAELVPAGMITNLDEVSQQAGIDWNSFNSNILNATMFDGKHMAVPLDTHALIMYYNKKILGNAGLLDADGKPAMEPGAEGFVTFLSQVKEKTADDIMPFVATSNGNSPFWMWWTLYSQMDGKLLSEDGKLAAFNNEKGKKALQFVSGLVYDSQVWPKNVKNGGEIFSAGKAAINFNGVWSTGSYEKNKNLEFAAMPIPQLFDKQATWGDSHSLVLPVQKNKDEKRMVAAASFINWLADNGAMWAKAGHVPSKPAAIDSSEFKALPYRSSYVEVVDFVNFMPNSDKLWPVHDILRANFNLVMNGQASVDEVLVKAEKEVNELLAK